MLRDNHWYRMLTRPNVELVTERIDRIGPDAIVTCDGARHPADSIAPATGFQTGRMLWPMMVRGRAGDTLRDSWGELTFGHSPALSATSISPWAVLTDKAKYQVSE